MIVADTPAIGLAVASDLLRTTVEQSNGNYHLRLAQSQADAEALYRLRFRVFNLELDEGLSASYQTGMDQDAHDPFCHHLLVETRDTGEVVGTYRLQDREMARRGPGFYSQAEFELSDLGEDVLSQSVELGRACIDLEHRNTRVLFLLWRGLAAYMTARRRRFFFGCCSLTSQDPAEGQALYDRLDGEQQIDHTRLVRVQPAYQPEDVPQATPLPDIRAPKLMRLYLTYGARIVSPPAIDREFGTIDYLALFDIEQLSDSHRRMFLDSGAG